MASLFEAAASDPALMNQMVDSLRTAAAQAGVSFDDDATQLLDLLSENAAFNQAAQTALSEVAAGNGLTLAISAASEAAGAAAALAAIIEFTAHKDNPTQIPVGTPIALLFIAAALLFVPTVYSTAGETLFGSETMQQVQGVASFP